MGRLLGLVLFVLALWISAELYSNGVQGAFGGVFSREDEATEPIERARRAAGAFQRAYDSSEDRVDRALDE